MVRFYYIYKWQPEAWLVALSVRVATRSPRSWSSFRTETREGYFEYSTPFGFGGSVG